MASSEKVISPGVFTNEIDKSFLPAAIAEIGAAIVGPTVKGPALQPTIVTSYSDFVDRFGSTFRSGSSSYSYLTSLTAKEYLRNSNQLLVVRTLAGGYSNATANVLTGSGNFYTGSASPGDTEATTNTSFKLHTLSDGLELNNKTIGSGARMSASLVDAIDTTGVAESDAFTMTVPAAAAGDATAHQFIFAADVNAVNALTNTANFGFSAADLSTDALAAAAIIDAINGTAHAYVGYGGNAVTSVLAAGTLGLTAAAGSSNTQITLTIDITGAAGNVASVLAANTGFENDLLLESTFTGGLDGPVVGNHLLISSSKDSVRWEITSNNPKKGTFSLLIRRGDDIINRKQILESWNGLSLDSNQNNYIAKRIGDQYYSLQGSGTNTPYLKLNGDYSVNSKYVRVEVLKETTDYIDENGNVRVPVNSSSLPGLGSGSFGGSFSGGDDGDVVHPRDFYQHVTSGSGNMQGLNLSTGNTGLTTYEDALNLLKNQDEFDINMILMPGIIDDIHTSIVTKAIRVCEDRQDCFLIIDPTGHAKNVSDATTRGKERDTNYAAMYWPWVKLFDSELGRHVWVPPSVSIAGVYSSNDKVAHPWYAPAGLNRGTIQNVSRPEIKLRQSQRDELYESNVNPIATFPGQGVTVWGQKTLQKKASALDRVNVRRLMIKLKKFIASSTRFLVFEQNNVQTRQRFLNIVNPFMEQVQSQSGLTSFRVIMNSTNNTQDIVDRNILYGQIFVQPTRTAEFIVLDFTIQPTGATFSV